MIISGEFKICNVDGSGDNNTIIDFEWEGNKPFKLYGDKLSQDEAHRLLRKIYESGCLDIPEDVKYVGLYHKGIFGYKYRPYIDNRDFNRAGVLFTLPGMYKNVDKYCFDSIDGFIKKLGKHMTENNHVRLEELKDDVKGCSVTVGSEGQVYYTEHPSSAWVLDYFDNNGAEYFSDRKWTWGISDSIKFNSDIKLKEIQTSASCFVFYTYYLSVEDLKRGNIL